MKTLYATDLDGTLLRSDETLSSYTCDVIGELVKRGMLFSFATARSYVTASRVTKGLAAHIPMIVYNGAFIIDQMTGKILRANFFENDISPMIDDMLANRIYPIVYAIVDGRETFSYLESACTPAMKQFVDSRGDDPRKRPLKSPDGLYEGHAFYVTCIDEQEKLEPLYQKYKDACRCVYHRDLYTHAQWLEMMPMAASKANAIRQLKAMLGCEQLVVFGDGLNDVDMFRIADVSCAMENAERALKAVASHVIGSNDEDGVAKWLIEHVKL